MSNSTIHVITPFSRYDLKPALVSALEKFNVIWHPIEFKQTTQWPRDWIHPVCMPHHEEEWDFCYEKHNYFISQYALADDEYYTFMNDDDMFEDKFFDDVRKQTADVLITSMLRGHFRPSNVAPLQDHDITPLLASPETTGVCMSGIQQLVVKGHILKQLVFHNSHVADGLMIEHVKRLFEVKYLPETFAYFNYFQPGRWNSM
jgi:hypothetical protein